MKEPSYRTVLTGGQLAYRRKDGVYIVPVGCLENEYKRSGCKELIPALTELLATIKKINWPAIC